MKLHTAVLYTLAAGCLVACAALKSAGYTIAGGAGGAAVGAVAGGPVGAAIGGGIGAFAGSEFGQNDELRNGSIVGDGEREKEIADLKSQLSNEKSKVQSVTTTLMQSGDEISKLGQWLKIGAVAAGILLVGSHYVHYKLNQRKSA